MSKAVLKHIKFKILYQSGLNRNQYYFLVVITVAHSVLHVPQSGLFTASLDASESSQWSSN